MKLTTLVKGFPMFRIFSLYRMFPAGGRGIEMGDEERERRIERRLVFLGCVGDETRERRTVSQRERMIG